MPSSPDRRGAAAATGGVPDTTFRPRTARPPYPVGRGALVGSSLLASAAGVLAWRALCAKRVEVEGTSMLPTLAPGDRLLVARRPFGQGAPRLAPGDLAVVQDPEVAGRLLVKRVGSVEQGSVVVLGDNPAASRDSRSFGPVPRELALGRAWYRYAPARSAGRLRTRQAAAPRAPRARRGDKAGSR